jgi:hypothetical protein
MHLQVVRKWYSENSTIGEFYVDGKLLCHTLEDRVRAQGAPKIYGKTAIPAGTYGLIMNLSTRFKEVMPLLLKVPGYEGVRIHAGNKDADTLGCVLLGVYDARFPDWVSNSRLQVANLYPVLKAAQARGEKITITLIDTQKSI